MTTISHECKARTKQGKPCQARALPGNDYCLFHDPARAAERAKARIKGGQARRGKRIGPMPDRTVETDAVVIETIADVLALVTRAINDTLLLENGVNRNRTLGTLASAAIDCLKVGELEQRL